MPVAATGYGWFLMHSTVEQMSAISVLETLFSKARADLSLKYFIS